MTIYFCVGSCCCGCSERNPISALVKAESADDAAAIMERQFESIGHVGAYDARYLRDVLGDMDSGKYDYAEGEPGTVEHIE